MPFFRRSLLASLFALLPLATFANIKTERFWLENTITRETYGPVIRQQGYRFQAGPDSFTVLDSSPGKISVARQPDGKVFGPYDIHNGHILDLGNYAFAIFNVQTAEVPDLPPDIQELTGVRVQGRPPKPPATPTFVRKPVPIEQWPLRVGGWIEPSRTAKYDWTIGGYAGEKSSDLKSTRLGASADWGNFFLRLGLVTDSKQSGSIAPATTALDSLKLEKGSGFNLAGGYIHPFALDEGWDILVGGLFEWTSESYDFTANTLQRVNVTRPTESKKAESPDPEPSADTGDATESAAPVVSYEYGDVTSSIDLSEFILAAVAGIRYQQDFWGAQGLLRIDFVSDISTSGSVHVLDTDLSISGDRSHPIVIEFGGWCYWLDHLRSDLTLQLGSIQSIRLGVSWEF